jgi:hypothetical protein
MTFPLNGCERFWVARGLKRRATVRERASILKEKH